MHTHFSITQPVPVGGAVQNTCIRVRLRGVLSVTAGAQLVINCVSSSSMIWGQKNWLISVSTSWKAQCLWKCHHDIWMPANKSFSLTVDWPQSMWSLISVFSTHTSTLRHPEEGTQVASVSPWGTISPAKYDYYSIAITLCMPLFFHTSAFVLRFVHAQVLKGTQLNALLLCWSTYSRFKYHLGLTFEFCK